MISITNRVVTMSNGKQNPESHYFFDLFSYFFICSFGLKEGLFYVLKLSRGEYSKKFHLHRYYIILHYLFNIKLNENSSRMMDGKILDFSWKNLKCQNTTYLVLVKTTSNIAHRNVTFLLEIS